MSDGYSPLERRALLTLLSLIRDREPDPGEWADTDVPLTALHEAMYRPGDRPYEIERRNQRQATRRALGRLFNAGLLNAIALGWCDVRDGDLFRWQGGGSRERGETIAATWGAYTMKHDTPRWKLVGLGRDGLAAATALENEFTNGASA